MKAVRSDPQLRQLSLCPVCFPISFVAVVSFPRGDSVLSPAEGLEDDEEEEGDE